MIKANGLSFLLSVLITISMQSLQAQSLAIRAGKSVAFIENKGQIPDQYGEVFLARFSSGNEPVLEVNNGGYLCLNSFFAMELNFSEAGPYTFVYSIDGVEQPPVTTPDSIYILSFPPNGYQDSVVINSVRSGECEGTIIGLPFVKIIEPMSHTEPVIECAADNQTYQVSFQLAGEVPPYLPIDPMLGTLNGNVFTSNPVPVQEVYLFQFITGIGCDTLTVAGTSDCAVDCPDLEMIIGSNSPQCTAGQLELTASPGASTYQWTGPANFTSNERNPVIDSLQMVYSGTYQLVYTYGNACIDSLRLEVEVVRSAQIENVVVLPITCAADGATIILEATGTGLLEYSVNGFDYSTDNRFTGLDPGMYFLFVRDDTECVYLDFFDLEFEEGASITSLDVVPPDCGETNGSITINVAGGALPLEYSINDGGTFQPENTFEGLPSGDYPVLVRDQNACLLFDWATLPGSDDPPVIDEILIEQAACAADQNSITVNAVSDSNELTYAINGVDFQNSNRFTNLRHGTYTIRVVDENGCSVTESITIPFLDVLMIEEITTEKADCRGNNGRLEISARGGTDLLVYQLDTLTQITPSFDDLAPGTYELTVSDDSGCTQSETVEILREDCPVYIANAFSPNEDGVNDRFAIFAPAGVNGEVITYQIFNRWGNQVYQTNGFPLGDTGRWWDGNIQGRPAAAGTYVFYLVIKLNNGKRIVEQGALNLIR